MTDKKLKIAVFMGGISAERDVSLVTGYNIAKTLDEMGYEVVALDVAYGSEILDFKSGKEKFSVRELLPEETKLAKLSGNIFTAVEYVRQHGFDMVFNALHGGYGEDGRLQALLELAQIPFTGSGSVSSAVSMDKHLAKIISADKGILTPVWQKIDSEKELDLRSLPPLPVVVKPNDQGSTVGLTIVHEEKDLKEAVAKAFKHGNSVLIEEYIAGRELTVSILNDETLPTIEIKPREGFYDYEAKYQSGKTEYVVPAEIPADVDEKIRNWALAAFKALQCRHYGRADFRYDESRGEAYFLELNTLPGMTATSLVPKAAAAVGMDFKTLLQKIVENVMS